MGNIEDNRTSLTSSATSNTPEQPKQNPISKLPFKMQHLIIALIILLLAIGIHWVVRANSVTDKTRTITVTGQTTVKAEPDEFVFYPTYEFKNADKQASIDASSKKSNELVAALKKLGVDEKGIKVAESGYGGRYYIQTPAPENDTTTYTLSLTVTVGDKKLAQKVQDYLVTTTPTGSVSPQADFSDAKRKELENTARDDATKDARAKADQSAKNLGFKVKAVKSVTDGSLGGGIYTTMSSGAAMDTTTKAEVAPSLNVQPGENDLSYSVTVVYFIK